MQRKYPKTIEEQILGSTLESVTIGCSGFEVIRVRNNKDEKYLKIGKKGNLFEEYRKIKWLSDKLNVPQIIVYESDVKNDYLITKAIQGEMLCSMQYLNNPVEAIRLLVQGINEVNQIAIDNCPFNMCIDNRLKKVIEKYEKGLICIEEVDNVWFDKYQNVENMLKFLKEKKLRETKCFVHGDYAAPNILKSKNSKLSYIDLGDCGISDRWYDIAICEKSIIRNFGEQYLGIFYEMLGMERNSEKVEYYLLLQELS